MGVLASESMVDFLGDNSNGLHYYGTVRENIIA
jgi:hypothetical protein